MDVLIDIQTEFLSILQDFVPCRGRCPKTNKILLLNQSKKVLIHLQVLSGRP